MRVALLPGSSEIYMSFASERLPRTHETHQAEKPVLQGSTSVIRADHSTTLYTLLDLVVICMELGRSDAAVMLPQYSMQVILRIASQPIQAKVCSSESLCIFQNGHVMSCDLTCVLLSWFCMSVQRLANHAAPAFTIWS